MVLALGPAQQVERHEARQLVQVALAGEPDFSKSVAASLRTLNLFMAMYIVVLSLASGFWRLVSPGGKAPAAGLLGPFSLPPRSRPREALGRDRYCRLSFSCCVHGNPLVRGSELGLGREEKVRPRPVVVAVWAMLLPKQCPAWPGQRSIGVVSAGSVVYIEEVLDVSELQPLSNL